MSYGNLAMNLDAQGRYAAAQPLHEKALEIHRRRLTGDHPITATTYSGLASNLDAQGKYAAAQPLHEKALEIRRRLLTDDHPDTARSYSNLATNLDAQGKYAQAQPLYEKALEINRRLLTDDHPRTAINYDHLALNLNAQGKYLEAREQWLRAVRSQDKARLRVAFTGLERAAGSRRPMRSALAAVHGPARSAGRGVAVAGGRPGPRPARRVRRPPGPAARTRRACPTPRIDRGLERLDRLAETTPKNLNQAERAKQFAELKARTRARQHRPGRVPGQARPGSQSAGGPGRHAGRDPGRTTPPMPPWSPGSISPPGARTRPTPTASTGAWSSAPGASRPGSGSREPVRKGCGPRTIPGSPARVRTELRSRPGTSTADLRPLIERLRSPAPGAAGQRPWAPRPTASRRPGG